MSKLPQNIKNKIEHYMKYSHKANSLRDEIDSWVLRKGIDSINADDDYSKRYELTGGIIQDILIDAAQGTAFHKETFDDVIAMIEREIK